MVRDCDFVIIVLSEAWKQRWEGTNAPTVGAGAVWDADTLKGKFCSNQTDFQEQTVIALLPGVSSEGRPLRLASALSPLPTGGVTHSVRRLA
jgi:hypothetical protein